MALSIQGFILTFKLNLFMLQLKSILFGPVHCRGGKQVSVCLETAWVDLQGDRLVPRYYKYINHNYTTCVKTIADNVEVNLRPCENPFADTQYLVVWLPHPSEHFHLSVL